MSKSLRETIFVFDTDTSCFKQNSMNVINVIIINFKSHFVNYSSSISTISILIAADVVATTSGVLIITFLVVGINGG